MPKSLKRSRIIPVHKNGSRLDISNYRPISLLSYIDKILEKALHRRIYDYLDKINFFCANQFGFRENHSTELALLSILQRIYNAIDSKEIIIIIAIDFRKAFEVIKHDILIKKLEHIGIRGTMLEWFKSYLNDRYHQVLVNGSISDPLKALTGVPQGSSLGPLLFLIYINDLQNVFSHDELNIFADDTVLIIRGKCYETLIDVANSKLKTLQKYLNANGIRLNETKTEYMVLTNKIKRIDGYPEMKVIYDGRQIKKSETIKLLGINLDNKLTFRVHVQNLISNKLRKFLPILYRLRNVLSSKNLLKIYFANINSLISCCLLFYQTGNFTNLVKLNNLQKRLLKIIFRYPHQK